MPFTFRKSFQLIPGVRINLNRSSKSITFGFKNGPHYTASSTGRRTTSMDLPGGLGWRRRTSATRRSRNR